MVNTKYSFFSFVPKVLYEQFSQFFNLYFLVVALSQLFPPLQIGLLFTYIAPLAFVLAVTMCKEGFDDYKRYRTDREINTELYTRLTPGGGDVTVAAQDISVGHVLRVKPRRREEQRSVGHVLRVKPRRREEQSREVSGMCCG